MQGFRCCLLVLLTASIFGPMTAVAQTFVCPNGPGPGEVQVGTTGGSGGIAVIPICASNGSDDSSDSGDVQPQGPVWETRWGAIATGGGGLGAVTDMRSENQAKRAAIKQCKKTAGDKGSKCKALSYYNQCAVIAWGATGFIFQRAVDLPTASSLGMQKCSSQYDDCEIYYSGCSYPKRID
jgi:Domain of unknown function (DUF4189)